MQHGWGADYKSIMHMLRSDHRPDNKRLEGLAARGELYLNRLRQEECYSVPQIDLNKNSNPSGYVIQVLQRQSIETVSKPLYLPYSPHNWRRRQQGRRIDSQPGLLEAHPSLVFCRLFGNPLEKTTYLLFGKMLD